MYANDFLYEIEQFSMYGMWTVITLMLTVCLKILKIIRH